MGVTPRDQVIRRCLHQLEDAPERLRNLADAGECIAPKSSERLRIWADAIENLQIFVPEELAGRQETLDRDDRSG